MNQEITMLYWVTQGDPGRTTEQYADDFARRQRLGLEMGELPTTKAQLEEQLAELERDGLIQCVDGKWEHVWVPVRAEQTQLF